MQIIKDIWTRKRAKNEQKFIDPATGFSEKQQLRPAIEKSIFFRRIKNVATETIAWASAALAVMAFISGPSDEDSMKDVYTDAVKSIEKKTVAGYLNQEFDSTKEPIHKNFRDGLKEGLEKASRESVIESNLDHAPNNLKVHFENNDVIISLSNEEIRKDLSYLSDRFRAEARNIPSNTEIYQFTLGLLASICVIGGTLIYYQDNKLKKLQNALEDHDRLINQPN